LWLDEGKLSVPESRLYASSMSCCLSQSTIAPAWSHMRACAELPSARGSCALCPVGVAGLTSRKTLSSARMGLVESAISLDWRAIGRSGGAAFWPSAGYVPSACPTPEHGTSCCMNVSPPCGSIALAVPSGFRSHASCSFNIRPPVLVAPEPSPIIVAQVAPGALARKAVSSCLGSGGSAVDLSLHTSIASSVAAKSLSIRSVVDDGCSSKSNSRAQAAAAAESVSQQLAHLSMSPLQPSSNRGNGGLPAPESAWMFEFGVVAPLVGP